MLGSSALSVALFDDHPLLLEGLIAAFTRHNGFRVISIGTSTKDIAAAGRDKPDVMIIGLSMTDDIMHAIANARTLAPATKIVVFTSLANVETVVRTLDAGASGYVLKSSSSSDLIQAIEAVMRGETYIAPSLMGKVIALLRTHSFRQVAEAVKFSVREEQVVRLLLHGRTNKDIAKTLSISERTVKHYMTILMQKLNVRNRVEVVIAAQKLAQTEITHSLQ